MIEVGLVGMGYFGPNYVRLLSKMPGMHLKYICDKNPLRLRHEIGVENVMDYRILAEDKNLDAVCIVTPPTTHYDIAKLMLESGKHVLVEKPMTTRLIDAANLYSLSVRADRTLMVGHIYVYHPVVVKMKQIVDHGNLGNVTFGLSVRIGPGPVRDDVHVYWDLLPHELSILDYLGFGSNACVIASAAPLRAGGIICDWACVTIKFADFIFTATCNWRSPEKTRLIFLYGDKNGLRFDDSGGRGPSLMFVEGGEEQVEDRTEPLYAELEHFKHCIETGDEPLTGGSQGSHVVAALEAIDRSVKTGGEVKMW